jgi:hypothetical protein
MSQTLTISEDLLSRLQAAAQRRGLSSVEQLLESWQANEDQSAQFDTLARGWKQETAHTRLIKRSLVWAKGLCRSCWPS